MQADHIRDLFDYHISTNRRLWNESILTLTDEQFKRKLEYSVGSIRNQCVNLMSVDKRWFGGLRGVAVPGFLNPVHYPSREKIRDYWDDVEREMRSYLDALTDADLGATYNELPIWAVLQHVALHGMDHRAQMLAMLHELGAPTFAQDYIYRFFKR